MRSTQTFSTSSASSLSPSHAPTGALGNIPVESTTCTAENDWKARRRAAFKVLNAEQKLLSHLTPAFTSEVKKRQESGDNEGAKLVMQVMRHSVRKCGNDTIPAERFDKKKGCRVATGAPGQAEVHAAGGDGHGHVWVGIKRCASTWFCPVCGPKIMSRRRQEVEKCVAQMRKENKHFIFCTFTFPHTYGAPLEEYTNKLRDVLRMFRAGRAWSLFKKRVGLVGYIRAQEVTHGKAGWHPHFHELLITDELSAQEAKAAADFLQRRWVDTCKKAGLIADKKLAAAYAHAADIRVGADPVSQAYLAKVVAWELSSVTTKSTRQEGNRQPFQILSDACAGDKQAKILWFEYMLGMYRKAALYWSPGLKAMCGIDEKTDEELLDGEVEKQPLLIASAGAFIRIARRRLQVPLLELTEANKFQTIKKIDFKLRLSLGYPEQLE